MMNHPIVEKQTTINNPNGTSFLVSTIDIAGTYETAVLDREGSDLELERTEDKEAAIQRHDLFVQQYTQKVKPPVPVKLAGQYLKLVDDLKKAAEAARPLADTEDGGTCNFDGLELELSRWNEDKTLAAIKAAGLSGHKTSVFRTPVYVIIPPSGSKGNARTRQAEKMRDIMRDLGYNASVWYRMD